MDVLRRTAKVELVHEALQMAFKVDGRWLIDGKTGHVYTISVDKLQRGGMSAAADIQRMCSALEADRSEYR